MNRPFDVLSSQHAMQKAWNSKMKQNQAQHIFIVHINIWQLKCLLYAKNRNCAKLLFNYAFHFRLLLSRMQIIEWFVYIIRRFLPKMLTKPQWQTMTTNGWRRLHTRTHKPNWNAPYYTGLPSFATKLSGPAYLILDFHNKNNSNKNVSRKRIDFACRWLRKMHWQSKGNMVCLSCLISMRKWIKMKCLLDW